MFLSSCFESMTREVMYLILKDDVTMVVSYMKVAQF